MSLDNADTVIEGVPHFSSILREVGPIRHRSPPNVVARSPKRLFCTRPLPSVSVSPNPGVKATATISSSMSTGAAARPGQVSAHQRSQRIHLPRLWQCPQEPVHAQRHRFHRRLRRSRRRLVRHPNRSLRRQDDHQGLPIQQAPHVPLRNLSRSLGLHARTRPLKSHRGERHAMNSHSICISRTMSSRAKRGTCSFLSKVAHSS